MKKFKLDEKIYKDIKWAITQDYLEKFKEYVDQGLDLNSYLNDYQETALHLAASYRSHRIIKFLIEQKVNLNIKNKEGDTALLISVVEQDVETVSDLIRAGANLNIVNSLKMNALLYAIYMMFVNDYKFIEELQKITELLINAGSDVNIKDKAELTALHWSVFSDDNIELVKKLLKAGADVNAKDNENHTALYYAKKNDNQKIVEILVRAGARDE